MAPTAVAAAQPDAEHGKGLVKKPHVTGKVGHTEQEQLVINTIRCLAADLIQQYKGGHPGTVMGAAPIGLALWRYHMRYNPADPNWFGRDRFVLSAGHACLLQYLMLHFSGYKLWTMDAIKKYHAPTMDGIAAGHPEIEYDGIEVTTGPLGQGIANAVGLAIAGKSLEGTYNKPDVDVIDGKVWCFTGDGCLQEGVGQEAVSLAGHLGLDNMILVYDNNSVTIDGPITDCFTDDTSAKMKAMGWHVIDVMDGSNDLNAVVEALDEAKRVKGKSVFVNVRTIIGFSSEIQGTGKAHGSAFGDDGVAYIKKQLGFDPKEKFAVPSTVYNYFKDCKERGARLQADWEAKLERYVKKYPNEGEELLRRIQGKIRPDWESFLPPKEKLPKAAAGTRNASGIVVESLVASDNSFLAGSADLITSTFVGWKGMKEFQNPSTGLGDFAGRQIRYGIREHSMVAIANGLVAYNKGTIVPIVATFFMFWIYAAPAARMGALMGLPFVGIATHDSLGIGEDGPTHQPIALAAFYRALPNINFIRCADAEEVMGAWSVALQSKSTPTLILLSRQPVPLLDGTSRTKMLKGGYVVDEDGKDSDFTLLSTGTEVVRAIETAQIIRSRGYKVRVVSIPSMSHFDAQTPEYRRSVIPASSLIVAIEPWSTAQWPRYAHAGLHMHSFGHSAPEDLLFEHFGFGPETMADKILAWAEPKKVPSGGWELPGVGDYAELLLGHVKH